MSARLGSSPFILSVIVVNFAIYGLFWTLGTIDGRNVLTLLAWFALWPTPNLLPWQVITYAFIHGGLGHLFFNMLGLWMFGKEIERYWGTRRLMIYYVVCVLGAAAGQLLVGAIEGSRAPTIGASGGVFGILLAFGMSFPNRKILLLIPPIPMKAKWVVIGYGLVELWFGVTGTLAGIAHFAHLGGMVFGFILIQYWRSRTPPSNPGTIMGA